MWWPRANLIYTFKNNSTIYVVHTPEYKIVEFDLEKNNINTIIEREYKRIKYVPPKDRRKPPPNAISPPEYEYYQEYSIFLFVRINNGFLLLLETKLKGGL